MYLDITKQLQLSKGAKPYQANPGSSPTNTYMSHRWYQKGNPACIAPMHGMLFADKLLHDTNTIVTYTTTDTAILLLQATNY